MLNDKLDRLATTTVNGDGLLFDNKCPALWEAVKISSYHIDNLPLRPNTFAWIGKRYAHKTHVNCSGSRKTGCRYRKRSFVFRNRILNELNHFLHKLIHIVKGSPFHRC